MEPPYAKKTLVMQTSLAFAACHRSPALVVFEPDGKHKYDSGTLSNKQFSCQKYIF
jgi:hypothetical protein